MNTKTIFSFSSRKFVLEKSKEVFQCAEEKFTEVEGGRHCGCLASHASNVMVRPFLYGVTPDRVAHLKCRQTLKQKRRDI